MVPQRGQVRGQVPGAVRAGYGAPQVEQWESLTYGVGCRPVVGAGLSVGSDTGGLYPIVLPRGRRS
ncbi:protein of unknown function [Streptomyces sp. KY75]|nr:protein of unknown function [Streptomyces sp. KY75]CAD5989805.1 protein of unknown function [Streptomyces sp. KY70]